MHPKISTFNNHFKGHCDSRYLCMLFDCWAVSRAP
jgi:hypothetical protein